MLPDPSDCNIVYFDEIDSTNAYAIREFDSLPDGTIVAAACQSAGRGRLGNQWVSEKGKGIYMTLVMKNVTDPFKATTAVSLGVLDALRKAVPDIQAGIKWPNDIYAGNKKLAGVLAEGKVAGGKFKGIVCGAGINVGYTEKELAYLNRPVTSVNILSEKNFSSEYLTNLFAFSLLRRYIILITDSPSLEEWRRENFLTGMDVTLHFAAETLTGKVLGIDNDGGLTVELASGEIRTVTSADVRIGKL